MIVYDKRAWTSHLLDVEGSMVREIIGRVSVCVLWSTIVVAEHHLWVGVSISPTVHTLVGVALGLLLVFRTNASYDRFWEGRRMWGSIINETRNLARGSRSYLARGAPDLAASVTLWTSAFAYAAMRSLRAEVPDEDTRGWFGKVQGRLPAAEVGEVLAAPHVPLAVAARISDRLAEARDRGAISDFVLGMLDQNVQLLIDYIGSCERIRNTPLPFVYVVHLRRALILYCFTLPFALVQLYGWWTILVTLLAAYMFFGIEEIGVEIENPFGRDVNDLPLETFCQTIERDVLSVAAAEPGEVPVA